MLTLDLDSQGIWPEPSKKQKMVPKNPAAAKETENAGAAAAAAGVMAAAEPAAVAVEPA